MQKYDAIVIGAGNSGLFAAAALSLAGLKPLVLERHNMPGGMATSFVRGRFEFDATLHGHFKANMEEMAVNDLKLETEFPFYPPDVKFITIQDGKLHTDFYDYSKSMAQQLDEKYPGQGYGKVFDKMDPIMKSMKDGTIKILDILGFLKDDKGNEASLPYTLKFALQIAKDHPEVLKYGFLHTQDFFDKFDIPDYLRSLFAMYWWYLGARLTQIPAFFSMAITDFHDPYAYVKNTAHSYLAEIEKFIRDRGGDILYNTAVTKIHVKDRKFVAVETNQGDYIASDYCICTIDPKIAIGKLMDGAPKWQDRIMKTENKLKENFSFFMVYLGLDATPEEIGITEPHVIINEKLDPNELWDDMGDLNAPKTIGVMCPNLIVDEVSPEGTSVVSISIPVTSGVMEGLSQKESIRMKHEYSEKIIKKVEEYMGIDLHSHIEEVVEASPATFARYSASSSGALGYNLSIGQFIGVRALTLLLNNSIKGLTFAGQFTGNLGYMNMNFGYRHGRKRANVIKKQKGAK